MKVVGIKIDANWQWKRRILKQNDEYADVT